MSPGLLLQSPKRGVIPSSAWMLRKIAIVGANGFVGRHLLELVAQKGIGSVGIVRSEAAAVLVQRLGGTPFRVADLEKDAMMALIPALATCDGLVYTASVSAGPKARDRTDPAGLVNVLAACRAAGVPKFIFFSGLGVAHYGMNPHCTNPYFLAKMAGEVALFRSSLAATVFRPSYLFGAGDEFLSPLIFRIDTGPVIEIPGDGRYRLQPVAVRDAARAVLGALEQNEDSPRVIDLVGPEILSYRTLVGRIASIMGRRVEIRERPVDETLALARESGYFGLRPHDLACLLCDEVSDPGAVESLVGGKLEPLDGVIARTVAALRSSGSQA